MKKSQPLLIIFVLLVFSLPVFLITSEYQDLFIKGLGFTLVPLTLLWIVSLLIRDSSIIDIYWGFGYVLIAWFYSWLIGWDQMSTRNWLLIDLVSIWGLRLTFYLGYRNIGSGEDYRYTEMRKNAGDSWWWASYFRVFLLQGVLIWIISALYVPALDTGGPFVWTDFLGIALWGVGIFFEAVGDWQLNRFKKDAANKGKVLNTGLWRYTRHPNYFGDACLWWGFFCFALAHPNGYYYFFGPLFMTFLLMKISGVAMLEKSLSKTKPQYEDYIRRTSAFFPWPPKD